MMLQISSRRALWLSRIPKSPPRSLSTTGFRNLRNNNLSKSPPPPPPPRRPSNPSPRQAQSSQSSNPVAEALYASAGSSNNTLYSPVHIPEDRHGVLQENHPAVSILANSSVVIQRQLELMNVIAGFEQANKYVIMDAQGQHIGYLIEQDLGVGKAIARQAFRTHRSFTTHVLDRNQREVLRFHRPFSWISSRIKVYDTINPDPSEHAYPSPASMVANVDSSVVPAAPSISHLPLSALRVIGEAQQQWAPLRRKYNLFLHRDVSDIDRQPQNPKISSGELELPASTALQVADKTADNGTFVQFAYVDEPFLSWDFSLRSEDNALIGSVNRNFSGFGREIFTDTGVYALQMDSAGMDAAPNTESDLTTTMQSRTKPTHSMTLDQRAIMLATAVSIDFDYFSRHSGHGGWGFFPLWFPFGGEAAGAGAGAGAAGAEAGAVGAAEVAGAAGGAATETALGTAAREGVGTIAGLETTNAALTGAGAAVGMGAMRGMSSGGSTPAGPGEASPQSPQSPNSQEDDWDDWDDFFGDGKGGGNSPGGSSGGGSPGVGDSGGSVADDAGDVFGSFF